MDDGVMVNPVNVLGCIRCINSWLSNFLRQQVTDEAPCELGRPAWIQACCLISPCGFCGLHTLCHHTSDLRLCISHGFYSHHPLKWESSTITMIPKSESLCKASMQCTLTFPSVLCTATPSLSLYADNLLVTGHIFLPPNCSNPITKLSTHFYIQMS